MMARPDKNRTYNPTTEELTKLVSETLAKNLEATWRDVHSSLLEKNPTWKIPERRVAKFVKRYKSAQGEDSASVVSTGSAGSFRKYFPERSSRSRQNDDSASVGSTGSLRRLFSSRTSSKPAINPSVQTVAISGQQGGRAIVDDDASSVSSVGSIRKFLVRGRSSKDKMKKLKEQTKESADNTPMESTGTYVVTGFNPEQPTNKGSMANDDMSVTSMSSVRRYFAERKARKTAKKASKLAAKSAEKSKESTVHTDTVKRDKQDVLKQSSAPVLQDITMATMADVCFPSEEALVETTRNLPDIIVVKSVEAADVAKHPSSEDKKEILSVAAENLTTETDPATKQLDFFEGVYAEHDEARKEPAVCEGCVIL
ncbi:hypothetical protein ACA910_003074 [Epithemia clementina (nom. ined.)]